MKADAAAFVAALEVVRLCRELNARDPGEAAAARNIYRQTWRIAEATDMGLALPTKAVRSQLLGLAVLLGRALAAAPPPADVPCLVVSGCRDKRP